MSGWIMAGALVALTPQLQAGSATYDIYVEEAAQRFQFPAGWIRSVMRAESGFDPAAISDKGAQGLMQVMPETWDELRKAHHLGPDPFAPRDNILAGTAYLRAMLDRYGTADLMLAAYHAGPGRTDAYLNEGRVLPASTRAYIATVLPHLDGVSTSTPKRDGRSLDPDATGLQLFVSRSTRVVDVDPSAEARSDDDFLGVGPEVENATGRIFAARTLPPVVPVGGAAAKRRGAPSDAISGAADAKSEAVVDPLEASPIGANRAEQ